LLAVGHAGLGLGTAGADLLTLGHAGLGTVHALGTLGHPFSAELLALHALRALDGHALRPLHPLRAHFLTLRGAAFECLRALRCALRRSLLLIGLVLVTAMAAAGSGGCRRGDRQRGDAGGKE
jgi:hypothetical protein